MFEHHEAQGSVTALEAFLHEYRIEFPVGIDGQKNGSPVTMRTYGMRGTPTTLYDRAGQLLLHQSGHLEDMALGASIVAAMASEAPLNAHTPQRPALADPTGASANNPDDVTRWSAGLQRGAIVRRRPLQLKRTLQHPDATMLSWPSCPPSAVSGQKRFA